MLFVKKLLSTNQAFKASSTMDGAFIQKNTVILQRFVIFVLQNVVKTPCFLFLLEVCARLPIPDSCSFGIRTSQTYPITLVILVFVFFNPFSVCAILALVFDLRFWW